MIFLFNLNLTNARMRENRESDRGATRAGLGQPRRSKSPVERNTGGDRGPTRVAENGGDGGNWFVVKSRNRKATQPEAGRRDSFRVSVRQEDENYGLQVRQRGDVRVHNQSAKESTNNNQMDGEGAARPPARGGTQVNPIYTQRLVSDSKQHGYAHSSIGNKVWAREARFADNDKKPLVVSKHVRRLEEVGEGRKDVVSAVGEGGKKCEIW